MSAHTPGPWFIQADEHPHWPGIDGDNFSVVIIGWKDCKKDDAGIRGRTDGEALANARLIAAAPDLLAALDSLLPFQSLSEGCDCDGCRKHVAAVASARAAIAAATGGKE